MTNQKAKLTVNVSIIAANYNNGKYLNDFISSVIGSTVSPKELIVIDDGSTDDSLNILYRYSHLDYLKVIVFDKNRGFCEALNAGIKIATGEYILRVDPDDILIEDRIEKQVDYLNKNKDVSVVGSNVTYFHSTTKAELCRSNFPIDPTDIQSAYLKGEHGVQHPSTMIRTSVMKQYRYDQENVKAEDYEIFARMIKDGHRFANISEPLLRMRVHNQSVSSNIKYKTIALTYKLRDEIFNTSTFTLRVRFYYWYILNYKRYLITQTRILKPLFLGLAVLSHPTKALNRIIK